MMCSDVRNFFGAIFEDTEGFIEIRMLPSGKQIFCSSMEEVLEAIEQRDAGKNEQIYFGVCPRSERKGDEDSIHWVPCLWADVDSKDLGRGKEEALEVMTSFEHPPSLIVDSGNGFHTYWLLKEPEEVADDNERLRIKGYLKGLSQALGGDHTFDFARILRVPGTLNIKDPQNPKEVKIVEFHPDRRYTPSDFEDYWVEVTGTKGSVSLDGNIPDVSVDDLQISDRIKALIREGWKPGGKYKSRSEADQAAITAMVQGRHSPEEIKAVFCNPNLGISEKYLEREAQRPGDGDRYLAHSIASARDVVKTQSGKANQQEKATNCFSPTRVAKEITTRAEEEGHPLLYAGREFYRYDGGVWAKVEEDAIRRMIRTALGSEASRYRIGDVLEILRLDVYHPADKLNQIHPTLLNVKNGMLDLERWELRPHDPAYLSTNQFPVHYDPDANCPGWERFIGEILPDDPSKRLLIQEYMGYSLIPDTSQEKTLLLVGPGANGKSTLLNVWIAILGKSNVAEVPLHVIENPVQVAELRDKLLNISTELDPRTVTHSAMFKAIVSGDRVQGAPKYRHPFYFNPYVRMVFSMNKLPRVKDTSHAFYRRLLITRFNRTFTEDEQDKRLLEKLLQEVDGIFLWALEGLANLQNRGRFTEVPSALEEVEAYRRGNNSVLVFAEECCLQKLGAETDTQKVYQEYRDWCDENGVRAFAKNVFSRELKEIYPELDIKRRDSGRGSVYVGLSLLNVV